MIHHLHESENHDDRHFIEDESRDLMTSNYQALLIIAHLDNKKGDG